LETLHGVHIDVLFVWFCRGLLVVYNAMSTKHSFGLLRVVIYCVHRIVRSVVCLIGVWLCIDCKQTHSPVLFNQPVFHACILGWVCEGLAREIFVDCWSAIFYSLMIFVMLSHHWHSTEPRSEKW